jgi:hypothetical protein
MCSNFVYCFYKEPSFLLSIRFLLSIIIFFGYCFNYMQKVDMGIAIVCMINNTALKEHLNIVNLTIVTKSYSNNNDTFDSECQIIKSSHAPKKFVCFYFFFNFS